MYDQPFVKTYTQDDYLASSKNWSIAVNSHGIIYVANGHGLLEGDGQIWKLYQIPSGGDIRAVAIDNNDRIYTGSFEEFGYWEADNTGVLSYTSLSDLLKKFEFHNEQIWKIIIRDETVYFQAFNTVFIYKDEKIDIAKPETNIIFLMEAGKHLIAQSISGCMVELVENEFQVIEETEKYQNFDIRVILPYENDQFLMGGGIGLHIWDEGKIIEWNSEAHENLKDKQINQGLYYNGNYYVGTITDGVYIFNQEGEILYHLNTQNGLLNNTILGMGFDREGNLWLNHDKGLSFVSFNFPYIDITSSTNHIGSLYSAAVFNGMMYLGTNQGLYYTRIQDENIAKLKIADFNIVEGSQGQVWDLKVFDNQLLCGHNNGTYRVEDDKLFMVSSIAGGFWLTRYNEDLLIQSTYSNLIFYRKDKFGNWKYYRNIKGLREPIKYVETDFRNDLWVSHNRKGIYEIHLNESLDSISSYKYYGKEEGFTKVTKTHVFKIDERIVITTGDKIYTHDDLQDSIIVYDELNNKLEKYRNAEKIIEVSGDQYWIINDKSAALFHIDEDEVTMNLQLNFNRKGYHLVDFNPNIVAVSPTQHIVCLEDGFLIVNPIHKFRESNLNPMLIRSVLSGEKDEYLSLSPDTNPSLKYKHNSISFTFSPLLFPGSGNRFSTMLVGLDEDWEELTSENEKIYSRLPWGSYTFKVKGITEFGQSIPEASYVFTITAPWYATKLAYIIYILIILAFFVLFPFTLSRYFRKKNESYQRKQEIIHKEKQREHQMMAEQKIIKLQNQHLQKELESKSKELANNTMVIIRRNETLTEIKEEFEKQKEILGSRFPNKNYEKIINLINRNLSNEEEWKVFEDNFDQAHNNFFKRLKREYPLLTPGDLRLCAYLFMNLSTKEIAPLLNISVRGVEVHRYRLRKKLNLNSDNNLVEFIMQF